MHNIIEEYNNYYTTVIESNNWVDKGIPMYNHGYAPLDFYLEYDRDDLFWENQCNLYIQLLNLLGFTKLAKKDVLEIGCGLGHGTNICKKYFPLNKITSIAFFFAFSNASDSFEPYPIDSTFII